MLQLVLQTTTRKFDIRTMSRRAKEAAPGPAPLPDLTTTREVINACKTLYMEKIRPIEVAYNFAEVRRRSSCFGDFVGVFV